MLEPVDYLWPLDDKVRIEVTRHAGDIYDIKDLESGQQLRLSWNHGIGSESPRLLFNGQDIETELFIGFVGLMDEVNDRLGFATVGTVVIEPVN
jgi:hypothetical protein